MAIREKLEDAVNYVIDMFNPTEHDPFDPDGSDGNDSGYEYGEDGNAVTVTKPQYEPMQRPNVISHPSANRGGSEIVVVEPRSFDDAATIVQHLKDRKIVMLDLHLLDKEQSQRTIDFVCGAAQALNGTPKKVGDLVFVFAPSNVTLSADTHTQQSKFNDSLWRTSLQ